MPSWILSGAFALSIASPLLPSLCSAAETVAPSRGGLSLSAVGGLNTSHPYVGGQLGIRFSRADFFEAYVDYSYGAPISAFPFHTVGVGSRTYFLSRGRFELYQQTLLGTAITGGGTAEAPQRELGPRVLGAFVTAGVGAQLQIWRGLHGALTLSSGYPVWLRPELAVRYRF